MRWLRSKKAVDEMVESDKASAADEKVNMTELDLPHDQAALLTAQGGVTETNKVPVSQLWRYATPLEKLINCLAIFAAIAAGIAQPALTIAFGGLTSAFTDYQRGTGSDPAQLRQTLLDSVDKNILILVGIGIGMFVCVYFYSCTFAISGELLARRVREKYLAAVLRQNVGFLETIGAGEVSTRIETSSNLFQAGVSEKVPQLAQFTSMFVAGFVIAFIVNWKLSVVLLAILPTIGLAGFAMESSMSKSKSRSLELLGQAGTLAEESISSIRTVQAFNTKDRLCALYDVPNKEAEKMGRRMGVATSVGVGAFFWIIYSAYALAFWWGATLYLRGDVTVGNIITCFFSLIIGAFALSETTPLFQALSNGASAAGKLYDVIERIPPIDSRSDEGRRIDPADLKGHIELRNIVFRYPSRPTVPVLKDLCLTFPAGQVSALVGASGCGKTSIVGLIERFYDPIAGQVLLDGVPLKDLNVRWLRSQIGLVSQEPTLFSASVEENVAYGLINTPMENAEPEEKRRLVEQACIKANADIFIRALPEGYQTRIGERGLLLSGGQRQRVAIARAIVSDPTVLLLDEATSALDSKSEAIVQDALDKASKGRTTIMIAHRLSTVRNAYIHVIGAGQVLESGTHADLLAADGAYARLVRTQRIREKAAPEDERDVDSENASTIVADEGEQLREAVLEEDKQPALKRGHTTQSVASKKLAEIEPVEEWKRLGIFAISKRLVTLNRQEWKSYVAGVASCCVMGLVYPIFSIVFGNIIGIFTSTNPAQIRTDANRYAGYLFAIACVAWATMTVQIAVWMFSAEALARKLRLRSFEATLKQDIAFFDKDTNSTGSLTSSISDNAEKITGLFGSTAGVILQGLVTLIVGAIVGLAYSWRIALVGIACLPFTVTVGFVRLYVIVLKDTKNDKAHSRSAQLACESANAVRTVASLTREADVTRLYSAELDEPQRRTIRFSLWGNLLYAFSQSVSFWVISLVFYYGSRQLVDGSVTATNFFIALQAVTFSSIEVGNVFVYVPDASKCTLAANSIFRLFDSQPKVDTDSADGEKPGTCEGHLKLEDVHFRYATRPHVPVLRGLSIEVKPGQFVALVGPSGCGKSTVISLLERFYDPLSGRITLDGHDVAALNVAAYRSRIALVAQESALYAGSVRTNVLLGSDRPEGEVTQADIEAACKAANIHDFVMQLPQGYDTELGGKGAQLSGGQRQRVALARALLRKPRILLLDEATSALDSESEKVVQRALDDAAKGRSTIAVAHRLSTIRNADVIYVLAEGVVLESGTHDELYALKGAYFELVNQQALET